MPIDQKTVSKITGWSQGTISNAIHGKTKLPQSELDKIMYSLTFFEETLPHLFVDKRFVDMCDVAIAKGRTIAVKEFAALLKHYSLYLQIKLEEKS